MLPKTDSPVQVGLVRLGVIRFQSMLIFTPNPKVRSLYPLETTPGIISLLAGKPNPDTFPFTSFCFSARSPINPKEDTVLTIEGTELAQALQYGPTAGEKQLVNWIEGLQKFSHGRKENEGWRVSIGAGSQDLIFKVEIGNA